MKGLFLFPVNLHRSEVWGGDIAFFMGRETPISLCKQVCILSIATALSCFANMACILSIATALSCFANMVCTKKEYNSTNYQQARAHAVLKTPPPARSDPSILYFQSGRQLQPLPSNSLRSLWPAGA